MAKVLQLSAVSSTHYGRRYLVELRQATLGSGSTADVVIQDRSIASRHAEVRQMLDRWFIVPLLADQSAISVNGLPISSQSRINHGDRVTIGSIIFEVAVIELEERAMGSTPPADPTLPRVGEYLVRRRYITAEQALRIARRQEDLNRTGRRVQYGQVAIEMGYISRGQLDAALGEQRSDFNSRFSD